MAGSPRKRAKKEAEKAQSKAPAPPSAAAIVQALGGTMAALNGQTEPALPAFAPGISRHKIETIKALHNERLARQFEALRLFEPLPEQDRFLRSKAKTRLYRGGVRAGKTTIGAVEAALAVTGTGGAHEFYPREGVRLMVVAWDMKDTGLVVYRKLCEEGAFKVIFDPETKRSRAFRPWSEWDQAYKEKARAAPPLIPPRMIKDIAWIKKNEGQPAIIRTVTDSEILFFSSLGEPRKGLDLYGVWVDEEMQGFWLNEIYSRLVDHEGLLWWTATPQRGTADILNIIDWAEREQEKVRENLDIRARRIELGIRVEKEPYQPQCEDFLVPQTENPHLSKGGRENLEAALSIGEDDDLSVRVGGEPVSQGSMVFPEFSIRGPHIIEGLDECLSDWTRYLIIDPGRACASTLFAVPPPEEPVHGGHVYGWDLIFIGQSDARQFAERAKQWFDEGPIERMWMDMHFGRQTHSSGQTEVWFYEQEMKRLDLRCRRTGHRFEEAPGARDEGIEAIRSWLRRMPDGFPKYRIRYQKKRRFEDFVRQMRRFSYTIDPQTKRPTGKPNFRSCDTIDCLRYASMLDLKWVPPQQTQSAPVINDYAAKMAERMRVEMAQVRGGLVGSITLGPQGVWGA